MQYTIQNVSTNITVMLDTSAQWNSVILKPGDTMNVTEFVLAELTAIGTTANGGPIPSGTISIIGPTVDNAAPVSTTVVLPGVGSWTLVTLGRFCNTIKFITTSTNCLVSYSGWLTGNSAPPTQYQIPIVPDTTAVGVAFSLDMPMVFTRSMYVSGTGSLTIIGM